MDGINGTRGGLTIAFFDTSVLADYYAAGAQLSEVTLRKTFEAQGLNSSINRGDAAVIPPWEAPPQEAPEDPLENIFSSGKLIDLDDPLVANAGGDENFKNLFALYRGLSRVTELTNFAQNDPRAETLRPLLDRKLQDYIKEIESFVATLDLDDATVIQGLKENQLTSTLFLAKEIAKTSPVHFGAVVSEVRDDAIPGLTGTEKFTITATTSGGTKDVSIDLSAVSGTLNVDNISSYINSQLAANSVFSTVNVERTSEFAYGFRVNLQTTETLSFSADAANESPAVYLAGTSGVGDNSNGYLLKLDDLGAASPNQAFRTNIDTTAADSANAVAVDSKGFAYTVGSTGGDIGTQTNSANEDVYLRKYDASGVLIWSRLLGATDQANGFSVAVDSSDNIIVGGQTNAPLSDTAIGGGYDTFVTKYNSDGDEQFTRQFAPISDDAALSVTANAAGEIFIAGYAKGTVGTGTTHNGAADAYVTKLDASGNLLYNKQFGGSGDDRATGIAIDASGNIFVAAESDGNAVLRKYADSDASQTPIWEANIGAIGSDGAVAGLAIGSNGNVYVTGSTSNGSLNGSVAQAHSGGVDSFVSQITDNGTSATLGFVSYVGSSGTDRAGGIAVRANAGADEIYITGNTDGSVAGQTQVGETDAFAVKLNSSGTTVWGHQFGGGFNHSGNAIAFDENGTSVLSRLGLPGGTLPLSPPEEVINLTSARPGQYFEISVEGASPRRVSIENDDSLGFLAFKINRILGDAGRATIENEIDGRVIQIEAKNEKRIDIIAGADGFDALAPLGLREVTLFGEALVEDEEEELFDLGDTALSAASDDEDDSSSDSVFALGIISGLNVKTKQASEEAGIIFDEALRNVREAYKFLTDTGETTNNFQVGAQQISAADQAKINELNFALERLQSASLNGSSAISLLT